MLNINSFSIKSIILLWCQLSSHLDAAKIFSIFGMPHPADNLFTTALLNTLHARGHEIIAVIKFPHKIKLHKDIESILIEDNYEINKAFLTFSVEHFDETFFPNLKEFCGKGALFVSNIVSHPRVQAILKHERFDLILLDISMSEALYGLGEYFNAPMVGISNYASIYLLDLLVGNISPISIIPTSFVQHTYEVTFLQRCLNVALNVIDRMILNYLYLPHQQKLYMEIFPSATQTFEQAMRNFSLVLINHHFSLHYPRPYVPNMIEVAGLHIEENDKSLPVEIQSFLDESTKPIIYIRLHVGVDSFGLNIINSTVLYQVLKELNYKAIWHSDHMPQNGQRYSNILQISNTSHFPILAHPNVKLFITNGEVVSIIEAAHYGKPLLGILIFGSEYININMAKAAGYALGINFKNLNEVRFKATVLALLANPMYTSKAKQLSTIFRDQAITPKDKAVYWIEYCMREVFKFLAI